MVEDDIGVYGIYCSENDKVYIGASRRVRHRIRSHFILLSKDGHRNRRLQNDFNKHGVNSFHAKIFHYFSDARSATSCERAILRAIPRIRLYNAMLPSAPDIVQFTEEKVTQGSVSAKAWL